MPSEHNHGDPKDIRIEQLLAGTGKSRGQCCREHSHEKSAQHTTEHAAADPRAAMTDARVTASRIPMIRPASNTSRKRMINAASTDASNSSLHLASIE
jgi:hypothetical protein